MALLPFPVLIEFEPALFKMDAWGRLDEISALGGRLRALAPLGKGARIKISFELFGDKFEGLPCRTLECAKNADGYFEARLAFIDELHKRRLAKLLADVLSR